MTSNDKDYRVIPLHKRPDLIPHCCLLLNSEWPRSETARLKYLNVSCDDFPTCLILINNEDKVLGHCKISLISRLRHSCFMQSVIIDYECRSQGFGSRLLHGAEEYVAKKGIKNIYLITKGQEVFYLKNGYKTCDPFKASGINDVVYSRAAFTKAKLKERNTQCCGPPPPPMPNYQMPKFYDLGIAMHRTHMVSTGTDI